MNHDTATTPRSLAWPMLGAGLLWLLLLLAIFSEAWLVPSSSLGDHLTRNTIRLALLYYAGAVSLMIFLRSIDWACLTQLGRLARWLWTLAWAAYLTHLAMAFHHIHHWSHGDAAEHTRQVSGFGEGIYISHLFTLVWTADVLFWWLSPAAYSARAGWIGRFLHGFMLFMIFNATIVFETGWIRWAGVLLFAELAGLWLYHRKTPNRLLLKEPLQR
jgi:hypothetical protein